MYDCLFLIQFKAETDCGLSSNEAISKRYQFDWPAVCVLP